MKPRGALLTLLVTLIPIAAFGSSAGIFDRATAGCTGNGCHATSASPTTRVCISGLPSDETYAPNVTYSLTVFVDGFGVPPRGLIDPTLNLAGFNLSVSQGTLAKDAGDTSLDFPSPSETDQVAHTFPGNKQNHWSMSWTAPASGSATLNLAGNAVNGSSTADTLDLWNTTSVTLISGSSADLDGVFCDPPIPLPQLLAIPAH